jgi:hypothetical protein
LLNESYANGGNDTKCFWTWKGTNWQNEVFLISVPILSMIFLFSGGSDTYAVSGSHLGQEGIIGGDKSGFFEKYGKFHLVLIFRTDLN